MAETVLDEILDRFQDRFENRFSTCQTAEVPLHGGEIADFEIYKNGELKGMGDRTGLAPSTLARLIAQYGTDYLKIVSLGFFDRELLQPITRDVPLLKGEVIHAVEDEMAMTVEDFMERRTDIMHFHGDGGTSAAEEVARLMARRLAWDEAERKRQVQAYLGARERTLAFRTERVSVLVES